YTYDAADDGSTFTLDITADDGIATDTDDLILTVNATPEYYLATEPDSLFFTAEEGEINIPEQSFAITETGGAAVSYISTESAEWMTLNNTAGTTPDNKYVHVYTAGLTPGVYIDSVEIASAAVENSPIFVYIQFTVTPKPKILVLSADTLYFEAYEDIGDTTSQYLYVTEAGDANIPFNVNAFYAADWLNIPDTMGVTPDTIWLQTDVAGLAPGVYLDSMIVYSDEAENTPMFYVQFTVLPRDRILVVSSDTLFFGAIEGGDNPDSQAFTIEEVLGDAIDFATSDAADWLDATGAGTTPGSVYAKIDITDMLAGTFVTTIQVTSETAVNDPLYVPVKLTIGPAENNPPELAEIGPQEVAEGADLTFTIHATDPDGTIPALTTSALPDGATFDDSANGTGLFVWWPTYEQEGVYYVTFFASDGIFVDSERVEILVTHVNRDPEFTIVPNDTTIDECMTLDWLFVGTDPDGDPANIGVVGTLPDNMTATIDADTILMLYFEPDTTQAGEYLIIVSLTDGIATVFDTAIITLEDCYIPPPCNEMILSDTVFMFVDTIDGASMTGSADLDITSSLAEFDFTITTVDSVPPVWLAISGWDTHTPSTINIGYAATGIAEGSYGTTLIVMGDSSVCDPNPQYVTVLLDIVDTTTEIYGDTITVATVPGVPGSEVIVPVNFTNSCDLAAIATMIEWSSDFLFLDSVSWIDSRVDYFLMKYDTINPVLQTVFVGAADSFDLAAPGNGNFVNLYFTLAPETPAGTYDIGFMSVPGGIPSSAFILNCGSGFTDVFPIEIAGGIVVDTSANFTCGYVVDPDGDPISGATVDLYGEFPIGPAEFTTTTSETGAFSFSDFTTIPFDLWAYHEGYYPGLVENVNFGETGIMIVLTPVEEITPTYEVVNFYCDYNLYFDEPVPVGSIIDAYDPDDVHCGTFYVTELGRYGFLPVYRDDEFSPEDEGAEPGNVIRFFINGFEAEADVEPIWTANGDSWQVCLQAGEITRYCDLLEGWNLVSWSVDHEDDYIENALASIDGCLEVVLGFEQGALTYDPNMPQFSTLWYVDHLSGYWIKVSCDVTLEITGAKVSPATPIEVTAGWNLVSYLPDFDMPVETAISSLDDNLVALFGEDGVYIPGDIGNTLSDMAPCKGYWVKVDYDDELIYPTSGPVLAPQERRGLGTLAAVAVSDVTPTNSWMNVYAHNLTLDDQTVRAGATITAHTQDGLMVGSFTMAEDGLFGFMPVYGDVRSTAPIEGVRDGETFYLAVDGVETAETFTFNGNMGNRVEITNLSTGKTTDNNLPIQYGLSQNYPNPFNPTTTIAFSLPTSGTARIEVFNILGELVATPFDGMAESGENLVEWDGTNSSGRTVSSGIYFYRLSADNYSETKKMTLLK
ncbi:MAG: hypothetical protein DRH04_04315, partial [Deltaproteobacteria bacterium]